MIDRIVEISNPAILSVRDEQLVIARESADAVTTPLSELAVLLIAHPRVTLTQAVLSRIALNGGSVVTCDDKFLPASMLLPVQAHFIQTERFAKQIEIATPLRKRLWKRIVQAKICSQANLLHELHGNDGGLGLTATRVRSGDPDNLEAWAARRYWGLIFGDKHFRRGGMGPDQNRHLDYGYTALRAATARALCAAGLHPSLGLRHHNRYDPFSLAADLMEPFRPIIDRRVYYWVQEHDPADDFDSPTRMWMLGALTARYQVENEERTLFDILLRTANSLASVICGDEVTFEPPEEFRSCAE